MRIHLASEVELRKTRGGVDVVENEGESQNQKRRKNEHLFIHVMRVVSWVVIIFLSWAEQDGEYLFVKNSSSSQLSYGRAYY